MMTRYKSKSGKSSGVTGFELGKDYITVEFNFNERYTYSYSSEEEDTIEKMKALATKQKGLSTFISRHHPQYELHQSKLN